MNERPARQWEGWSAAELAARWGAGQVRLFARVGSTNAVGRRLGLTEGAAPLVIVADEQVAGRGRAGRGWHSPAGLGLWVSAVVPPVDAQLMPSLPLRVGLAVAAALDDFLPSPGAAVKWPNDLWIADRKLGGILCETSWQGSRPGPVVVGVGLNLLHRQQDFPAELRETATSIALEADSPVSRSQIADRVVPAILRAAIDPAPIVPAEFATRDALHGRRLAVYDPVTKEEVAQGVGDGVRQDGALRLRTADETLTLRHGTVRPID